MDLALTNLHRLICHKTQATNQPESHLDATQCPYTVDIIFIVG